MFLESKVPESVDLDLDVSKMEYSNMTYMCIKEAGAKGFKVPENLEGVVGRILRSVFNLNYDVYKSIDQKYCYFTIKRGFVQPNSFGNREGWHIDGFLSDQDNFIWSDHPAMPTEVARGTFDVTPDHTTSLGEMEVQASRLFHEALEVGKLYHLNRECVHRPTRNNTDKAVLRTFIKITFTTELFNCFGNAWNYKLPHIKPTTERHECRNHGRL